MNSDLGRIYNLDHALLHEMSSLYFGMIIIGSIAMTQLALDYHIRRYKATGDAIGRVGNPPNNMEVNSEPTGYSLDMTSTPVASDW